MVQHVSLGGVSFQSSPEQIRWNFKMKVARQKTIGGQVVQIIGTTVSDITVTGRFAPDKAKKDEGGWEAYNRFRDQVRVWVAQLQDTSTNPVPLRLVYAPRGWNFGVYVKALTPITDENTNLAPQFSLTLFVADDSAKQITKGVKDLYMKRLMDGIGWKQTEYNGPSDAEVESYLGGMTVAEYLATEAQAAFDAGVAGKFGQVSD